MPRFNLALRTAVGAGQLFQITRARNEGLRVEEVFVDPDLHAIGKDAASRGVNAARPTSEIGASKAPTPTRLTSSSNRLIAAPYAEQAFSNCIFNTRKRVFQFALPGLGSFDTLICVYKLRFGGGETRLRDLQIL